MKTSSALLLICVTGTAAFLAGRWTVAATNLPPVTAPPALSPRLAAPAASGAQGQKSAVGSRPFSERDQLAADKAKSLSSPERLALVAKGALIFDSEAQADFLCGLLSVLNKEEIAEAERLLGDAQNRGNFAAQRVWDTVWKQWGKVDPTTCLANFAAKPGGKSRTDARHVMEGWMETDPAAALTWAKEPKTSFHEAAAAAYALTKNADGDPQKLETSLLALPAGDPTAKDALLDYFDMASLQPGKEDTSTTYDQLPASLKAGAWPVAMQRLIYTDAQTAVNWLDAHVNDPGRDYESTYRLIDELGREDPAGTAKWAAGLPAGDGHPAGLAIDRWLRKDPVAAKAWIMARPENDPLTAPFLPRLAADAQTP